MPTKLEIIEDDLMAAAEQAVDEALTPALNRLGQRIDQLADLANLLDRVAKLEHWMANLGDLARLSERVAKCEELLMLHTLDIDKNRANIKALVDEMKLGGQIDSFNQAQITDIKGQVILLEERLTALENSVQHQVRESHEAYTVDVSAAVMQP